MKKEKGSVDRRTIKTWLYDCRWKPNISGEPEEASGKTGGGDQGVADTHMKLR